MSRRARVTVKADDGDSGQQGRKLMLRRHDDTTLVTVGWPGGSWVEWQLEANCRSSFRCAAPNAADADVTGCVGCKDFEGIPHFHPSRRSSGDPFIQIRRASLIDFEQHLGRGMSKGLRLAAQRLRGSTKQRRGFLGSREGSAPPHLVTVVVVVVTMSECELPQAS